MLFTEDLGKNLELCMLRQESSAEKLRFWCGEIDQEKLSERDSYKKKTEILLLSSLLKHYPDIEIENLTGESPDFIVKINNKRIGLEISEIINDLELKKKEIMINHIFRDVEKQLIEMQVEKGIYHIDFSTHVTDFSQKNLLVQEIISTIKQLKKSKLIKTIRRTPYKKGVLLVLDYGMSLFDALEAEKILHIIEKKNNKHFLYSKKIDNCWLILVSNMHNMSSRYSYIHEPEILNFVESPFQRILYLENLYSEMVVIK
ncbi:hypothetical protein [Chryseobacterium sp. T1]